MHVASGGGGTGIEVDLGTLETIASRLDSGAETLEALADSTPTSIDAGPMTGLITALVGRATANAGTISDALSSSAEAVRSARTYYQRSDAEADATMAEINKAMPS